MDGQVSIPGQPHPHHLGEAAAVIAAQNMQRLLNTYRTIAAHTIGGPASTSLEAKPPPPGHVQNGSSGGGGISTAINGLHRSNSDNNNLVGPPNRKLTPNMYASPWSLSAGVIGERRRNSSSSSSGGGASVPAAVAAASAAAVSRALNLIPSRDGETARSTILFQF